MPTVVDEELRGWPVVYSDWDEWRRARQDADARPAPAAVTPGEFCARCWGQGRTLSPAGNGEGHVPVACPACSGSGRAPARRGDG